MAGWVGRHHLFQRVALPWSVGGVFWVSWWISLRDDLRTYPNPRQKCCSSQVRGVCPLARGEGRCHVLHSVALEGPLEQRLGKWIRSIWFSCASGNVGFNEVWRKRSQSS